MKEEIISIVNNIYQSYQKRGVQPVSLLLGEAGYCLFEKKYLEFPGKTHTPNFEDTLQDLAENSIGQTYPTLCNGKAGINWFFAYLNKNKILSKSDWKELCDDDVILANWALEFLKTHKNPDLLHGGIGIAYHLLYAYGNSRAYKKFFADFFTLLQDLIMYHEGKPFFPDFDIVEQHQNVDKVNLGLAHGIPSILKFCLQCYKQNICSKQAKEIALQVIDVLRTCANKDTALCYFPYRFAFDADSPIEYSRLGWCYGDLGVGIILYQAAITFNDQELEDYAIEVLLHTTNRKDLEHTQAFDAGLCHGTAGIAHIYNRMWHYTQNIAFKNACDFWIEKTIDLAIYEDGVGGYKSYEGSTKTLVNSYSLLEGSCGIGLALMSYITGDFSWDFCMMLDD